jgi:putative membrane protein
MHRRIVLTGLAAVAAAPSALAQQPQPATPRSPMPQTGGAAGGTFSQSFQGNQPVQGGQGQMGPAEMQHAQQTLMLGSVALQTSEVALQKAQDEDVKQFAQFEADEQKTIAEVLRSMMEPAGTASAQPAQPQPDQQHAAMIQKLQQAKAGDQFDKMYIDGQIQGHQELLQVQETYLKSNSRNREHMNMAKLARGHIKEHIAMLQDIKQAL